MGRRQKRLLGLTAGVSGMLLVYFVAWQSGEQLGNWRYALYGASVLVLAGLSMLGELTSGSGSSGEPRNPAEQLEEELQEREQGLRELAKQLNRREQSLANKLVTFHEWMEFPEPVDLNQVAQQEVSPELTELVEKDHQVIELLEVETERIFDAILANKYVEDGTFQPQLLRDEVFELANSVARVYHPDPNVKWPLLETSAEQIMVATSRAAMQLLVVIDQLPLNVKQMSISSLYGYVSRAVQAYGVYKAARPYLDFASNAYYVGRFALGINPAALGAWWVLQKVGKRTGSAITNRFLNRQALGLLNNMVRAVGFEVAQIYGGDFRHRDANWIYAAELSEVVATFPATADSLAEALEEVGVLQLRSEYDRIYLYRMMAAGRSCQPQQYHSATVLSGGQQEEIAKRLIRFVESCYREVDQGQRSEWREKLSERLQVPREASARLPDRSQQHRDALTALANFLVHHKHLEPSELPSRLSNLPMLEYLAGEDLGGWLESLEMAQTFEVPAMAPESEGADLFLESLVKLQIASTPRGPSDLVVVASGPRLGVSREEMRQRLDTAYLAALGQRSSVELPGRLPAHIASLVLDSLAADEQVRCLYPVLELSSQQGEQLPIQRNDAWLFGTAGRLFILASQHRSGILWQSESTVQLESEGSWLKKQCCLVGGRLVVEPVDEPARVRLGGALLSGYDESFGALLELNDRLGL